MHAYYHKLKLKLLKKCQLNKDEIKLREKLSKIRNAANKSNIKLNIKLLNKAWIKLLNEKKR